MNTACRLRLSLALFAITSLLAPQLLPAAEALDPPMFVQLRTSIIKPGMATEYESFLKRLNALRAEHGEEREYYVQQGRTGLPAYYTFTPHESYAELKPNSWGADYGDREAARLRALIAQSVEHTSVQTFVRRPELGREPPAPPFETFVTLLVTVKMGQNQAYEEALMKLVEATEQVAPELYWLAYSPDFHSAGVYRFVVPTNWDQLDDPGMSIPERLVRAFGEEEGNRWLAQLNDPIESVETRLTMNRMDLSYQPQG